MINKTLRRQLSLCNDLINIFTDYAFTLDEYFKDEKNRNDNPVLYQEYQNLNANLKYSMKKNGFDKK